MKNKTIKTCDRLNVIIEDMLLRDVIDVKSDILIGNEKILGLVNGFEDGKWRNKNFENIIWDNVQETALSKDERDAMIGKPQSLLVEAAKRLRITDKEKFCGEIAEILLYAVMRNYYGALPVVPKIFYKQNNNDQAKGADSVHIVIEGDDSFSLWLGEAKFYDSIENDRLSDIVKSVQDTIGTEKIKKENSIITNLKDLDEFKEISDSLRKQIKQTLSQETSIDDIKPILHIPIMLLYECLITRNESRLTEEYIEKIKEFQQKRALAYFKKQIKACENSVMMYSEIYFHIILLPVPDKEEIINRFKNTAKFYRDE